MQTIKLKIPMVRVPTAAGVAIAEAPLFNPAVCAGLAVPLEDALPPVIRAAPDPVALLVPSAASLATLLGVPVEGAFAVLPSKSG